MVHKTRKFYRSGGIDSTSYSPPPLSLESPRPAMPRLPVQDVVGLVQQVVRLGQSVVGLGPGHLPVQMSHLSLQRILCWHNIC